MIRTALPVHLPAHRIVVRFSVGDTDLGVEFSQSKTIRTVPVPHAATVQDLVDRIQEDVLRGVREAWDAARKEHDEESIS